jgi:beta-N-acetylhexosaminidase
MDAGALPVLKHAPGHGRATLDSHEALPRIETPLSELDDTDFAPFRSLSDLPMAMTAHIVLPEIDPDLPLTMSEAGVRLLREELGLGNLLMTDDISMGALSGTLAAKATGALKAGCDLVLHCNGDLGEMETLAAATAGQFSPAAQSRADTALKARRNPIDIDIPALQAEFDALIEGAKNA